MLRRQGGDAPNTIRMDLALYRVIFPRPPQISLSSGQPLHPLRRRLCPTPPTTKSVAAVKTTYSIVVDSGQPIPTILDAYQVSCSFMLHGGTRTIALVPNLLGPANASLRCT